MYYDINLRSNWSEPSKVDSLPSLSPKLPTWLKFSYSPGWWWLGCPPTQWWLPDQAVEACHQVQDRLSLAEERPNTIGSSLAAREKHSHKHTSLLRFVAISNTKVKIASPKPSWHMQPFGKSQNIPFTPYHHPLSMLVFRQAFVRQFIWRRVISKYCFTFQLLRDKKGKKNYLWHIWKVVYSGSPWVKWVESTVLVPVSFTSGLCWFQISNW